MMVALRKGRVGLVGLVVASGLACAPQGEQGAGVAGTWATGQPAALSGDGGAVVLLNELEINPPGTDQPWEYIELMGTPGMDLKDHYMLSVEGDLGTYDGGITTGVADTVWDLGTACAGGPCALGSNGLLMIKASTGTGHPSLESATTLVEDPRLNSTNPTALENGTDSFLLVYSPEPLVEHKDYDVNDDGILELPADAVVLDSVAWSDARPQALTYGSVLLASVSTSPDGGVIPPAAATRVPGSQETDVTAWYWGMIAGAPDGGMDPFAAGLAYHSQQHSPGMPLRASLTPGGINYGLSVASSGSSSSAGTTSSSAPRVSSSSAAASSSSSAELVSSSSAELVSSSSAELASSSSAAVSSSSSTLASSSSAARTSSSSAPALVSSSTSLVKETGTGGGNGGLCACAAAGGSGVPWLLLGALGLLLARRPGRQARTGAL